MENRYQYQIRADFFRVFNMIFQHITTVEKLENAWERKIGENWVFHISSRFFAAVLNEFYTVINIWNALPYKGIGHFSTLSTGSNRATTEYLKYSIVIARGSWIGWGGVKFYVLWRTGRPQRGRVSKSFRSFLCASQRNEPKKRAIGTYGSLRHLPLAARRRHWLKGSVIRYHKACFRRASVRSALARLCQVHLFQWMLTWCQPKAIEAESVRFPPITALHGNL